MHLPCDVEEHVEQNFAPPAHYSCKQRALLRSGSKRVLTGLTGSLGLVCAALAQAANGSGDFSCQASDDSQLECVTVTASPVRTVTAGALGALSALDTPFSTTSISSEDLEKRLAASLLAVFETDASVSRFWGADYTIWSSYLSVRGLAIDSFSGVKLDGMPVYWSGLNVPVEFMERVDVLKGSTGFVSGFGQPGGMVNYITKKPTDQALMSFDVGYRSDTLFSQHADFGGRMGDEGRFGYRLNVTHESGETATGTGVNRTGAALSLDARVTPTLLVTADAMWQEDKLDQPQPLMMLGLSSPLPRVPSSDYNPAADQTYADAKFYSAGAGVQWQFAPDWKLSLNLNRFDTELTFSQEYLTLLDQSGNFRDRHFDSLSIATSDFAQGLLEGRFDTGWLGHELVLGSSYYQQEFDLGYSSLAQGYVNHPNGNLYSGTRLSYTPSFGSDQPSYPNSEYLQKAVFISDRLYFSPQWSLLLGERYTDYDQQSWSYAFTSPTVYATTYSDYARKAWSPIAALMFKPVSASTIYASYMESLQPGGQVGQTYANAFQTTSPLISKQYEAGAKWDSSSWNASAAVFRLDKGAAYGNAQNIFVQDGVLRYQGIDVSGSIRATQRLRLGASSVYLDDATYKRTGVSWLIGKRVPGSTRFTATVQADYEVPGLEGLSLHADARYMDETTVYQNTAARATVTSPSFVLFNVAVGYRMQLNDHQLSFNAGVRNVFDRDYWAGGSNNVFVGAPRVFALNVQFIP